MNGTRNRWIILFFSIISNLCIGATYAWSVYQKPLMNAFGWSSSQASWAFSLTLIMMPISMTFAGKFSVKYGARIIIFIGGIFFGVGMFLSGFADSLAKLYLFHGVIAGTGVGTVYGCVMANVVKWFPDKKGLASGLLAAGLGSGAIVFAPFANTLIADYSTKMAFNVLGVVYLVVISISSLFVFVPEEGYKPKGWEGAKGRASSVVTVADKDWKEMMKDPIFYILCLMYVLGAVSGLMIIGHASPIGQDMVGLEPTAAAFVVSILSLANTLGRLFWGWISDLIGRYNAILGIFIVSATAMFFISSTHSLVPFLLMVCAIGLGYGGFLGIYPTINADMFGLKNLGQNYGIMFWSFAIAAIIGPRLAASVRQSTGDYSTAFLIAAGMGCAGIILTLYVKMKLKSRTAVLVENKA
jgi:OFA family oxalate/formate antiporter-like MFS transporter